MSAEICTSSLMALRLCCLQYLYNLEVYGHKQYTRRDKADVARAQAAVDSRVSTGDLGPLSPLD
jgi:hypothetical protein